MTQQYDTTFHLSDARTVKLTLSEEEAQGIVDVLEAGKVRWLHLHDRDFDTTTTINLSQVILVERVPTGAQV